MKISLDELYWYQFRCIHWLDRQIITFGKRQNLLRCIKAGCDDSAGWRTEAADIKVSEAVWIWIQDRKHRTCGTSAAQHPHSIYSRNDDNSYAVSYEYDNNGMPEKVIKSNHDKEICAYFFWWRWKTFISKRRTAGSCFCLLWQ